MRRILLLISTWVLTSAQECGPPNPECSDFFTSPVIGNPCWRISLNIDEREYCHTGKNIKIKTSDKEKSASVYCDGQILDCSSLPSLDFGNNGQLKGLQLSNCGLHDSLACVLRSLNATGLTTLALYHWETEISAETLRGLDGLMSFMVFYSDAVTRIPTEAFKQLPFLKKIRMFSTNITSIPSHTFTDLGLNLTFLEISDAKVTDIPAGAFDGLADLTNLSLFKNDIKIVDKDAFKGLPSLISLVLQDNAIEDLPADVFRYNPGLIELDIKRNRAGLRLRKDTLAGLTKLETIEISMIYDGDGRLTLDDQSLSGLTSLRSCDLSGAGLEELPRDLLKGTKALVTLKLDDNQLRSLPESVFEDLVNLQELSLSNNNLQSEIATSSSMYSGPFSTMRKLETLSLARNLIRNLSENIFIGASSLQTLDLSHNQIIFDCRAITRTTIQGKLIENVNLFSSPLSALANLETLDLSHNNLTAICDDFKNVMLKLRDLDLSYNKITDLTMQDVHFLSNAKVDLRYNQVTSIQPFLSNIPQNYSLLLGNNPYNCDCKNFELLRVMKALKYDMSEATCSQPKSLKGVPLTSLADARDSTSLDNVTCVLPDTPKNCECLVRRSKKTTECVCDKVVSNLPDPNNIRNYSFIDLTDTTKYGMLLTLKTIDNLQNIPSFVTNLSLSNLTLDTIPYIPAHIRYVDLTYNNIDRIPHELLSRNLTFKISHNTFKCTCANKYDIENLQNYKYKIHDFTSLVCHDGIQVEKIQVPHLCDIVTSYVIGLTLAIVGFILAVLVVLAYKYQLEVKIWLYNQGWTFGLFNYEKALDASKKNDIFLSYCHEDEDYVINELLPFLDAKYKVCVHTRDFIAGEDVITQIYRAVADSRRTVIVASKAYFQSPWCLEEMRAAYKQTELDQRMRAVVILRTDADPKSENISETVRSYLNLNTWIGEKDPRFWYRLCYFLPRDITVDDLRVIKVTKEARKNLSGQLNKVFVLDGKLGIDNEKSEVNGNLARNLCEVNKANVKGLNDEVKLAIKNLPGGLGAMCNDGKLTKNLPETLNVLRNEDGKLVNVAILKNK